MISYFQSDKTYHTGIYKCVSCPHETVIFIPSDYTLFGLMQSDKVCSNCGIEKDIVSGGDLIMRYDWVDPDYPPWQMQCSQMLDEEAYCEDCQSEVIKDWRKMVVACSQCDDSYMKFTE